MNLMFDALSKKAFSNVLGGALETFLARSAHVFHACVLLCETNST